MRNWHQERTLKVAEKQQARQLSITAATPDLVATIDIDGFFLSLNTAGYELLDLERDTDVRRHRLIEFYSKESANNCISHEFENALLQGDSNTEVDVVTSNGVPIPSSQVLIAQKDSSGNVDHFSVVLRDIRPIKEAALERERLINRLHETKKVEMIGRLAGGVAHDFNNIMSVIMGHAELGLLNSSDSSSSGKSDYEIILDSAQKAARLSNQLLDFSSTQVIRPQILDINEVIQNSSQLIESILGKQVAVEINAHKSIWPIRIDRSQLEQIILNMAVNTRDALDDGGLFVLSTENISIDKKQAEQLALGEQGDFVKFTIKDNGCGIEENLLDRVFDPFFTTKRKGEGTGLGLSAVYGAVKQNSGHIRVASKINHGTTFEIYFSRDTSNSKVTRISKEGVSPGEKTFGRELILLVEDDDTVRNMLTSVLENLDYRVLEALDGVHALEKFSEFEGAIELVVSDIVMPNMDGMELHRRILEIDNSVKFLLISGHSDQSEAMSQLDSRNVRLLSKPFPLKVLADTVNDMLS